jgi:hypothetical protein
MGRDHEKDKANRAKGSKASSSSAAAFVAASGNSFGAVFHPVRFPAFPTCRLLSAEWPFLLRLHGTLVSLQPALESTFRLLTPHPMSPRPLHRKIRTLR